MPEQFSTVWWRGNPYILLNYDDDFAELRDERADENIRVKASEISYEKVEHKKDTTLVALHHDEIMLISGTLTLLISNDIQQKLQGAVIVANSRELLGEKGFITLVDKLIAAHEVTCEKSH